MRALTHKPKEHAMTKNDDIKHLHEVKMTLTEREYIGLCKMAEAEDRKIADMERVVVRRGMFGILGAAPCECNDSPSADKS